MVPQIDSALGSESALDLNGRQAAPQVRHEAFPLPPVPYLDTMPWVNPGLGSSGLKVDNLSATTLKDLPGLLKQPPVPAQNLSSAELNGAR